METLKVDTSNPDLFKPPEFTPLTPGIHLFVVTSMTDPEPSKTEGSSNLVIKMEARCQDEDSQDKGRAIFENFVLVENPTNPKEVTTQKINEQKMVQFCLACGLTTKSQIEETGVIPNLQNSVGNYFKASTGVRVNKYMGEERRQAYIKKYLFENES